MLDYSRFFKEISDLFASILIWVALTMGIAIVILVIFFPEVLSQILVELNIPCETESCKRFLER